MTDSSSVGSVYCPVLCKQLDRTSEMDSVLACCEVSALAIERRVALAVDLRNQSCRERHLGARSQRQHGTARSPPRQGAICNASTTVALH